MRYGGMEMKIQILPMKEIKMTFYLWVIIVEMMYLRDDQLGKVN